MHTHNRKFLTTGIFLILIYQVSKVLDDNDDSDANDGDCDQEPTSVHSGQARYNHCHSQQILKGVHTDCSCCTLIGHMQARPHLLRLWSLLLIPYSIPHTNIHECVISSISISLLIKLSVIALIISISSTKCQCARNGCL